MVKTTNEATLENPTATSTVKSMRQPTLETLGLGNVLGIFRAGRLPVETEEPEPLDDTDALVEGEEDGGVELELAPEEAEE